MGFLQEMVWIIFLSKRNHKGFDFMSWETTTVFKLCEITSCLQYIMTYFKPFFTLVLRIGRFMSVSSLVRTKMSSKRPHLYGLGYPRQPSPKVTLAEVKFSLFLFKIQPTVYIRNANSSRGARQLGWASCLTSAGRVTLASGTTFLHINALARLPGTALGVASVT